MTLLAIPNVSEGRDQAAIDAIAYAFDGRLLDVHSDTDHHRSVFTLAGEPGELAQVVANGAAEAINRSTSTPTRASTRVGAIDVAPIVYLDPANRGGRRRGARPRRPARRRASAARVPLRRARAGSDPGRVPKAARKPSRNGSKLASYARTRPHKLHPTAGAVLVAARPPLIAFNVELAPPATLDDARAIAAAIREGGPEGLPAVRAIGLWLAARDVAQVSTNVEDHRTTPLARVVAAIARHATPSQGSWSVLRHGRRSTDSRRSGGREPPTDRGCPREVAK